MIPGMVKSDPKRTQRDIVPPRSAFLFWGFRRYVRKLLRKNFRAVRLSVGGCPIPVGEAPILVVLNHPSWWDPMLCVGLLDLLPDSTTHYAAIDAVAVQKYRILTRLGFFPVDANSVRGAANFLRTGAAILAAPGRCVWVTAQGRFADVRERPLGLQAGVGHLAARMTAGFVLPVALEYAFWNERTPEALIRVGELLPVGDSPGLDGKAWTARIELALTQTLDALNADAISRDPTRFRTLIGGTAGAGGWYDFARRARAWAGGRRFDPSHGGAQS